MFYKIFKREDITQFIKTVLSEDIYINKDIPNMISEEKISKIEYPIYIFIDAIIKYFIIIDDERLFDNYLEQLKCVLLNY